MCQCELKVSRIPAIGGPWTVLSPQQQEQRCVVDKALIINLFPPTLMQALAFFLFLALDGHQQLQPPCCLSATAAAVFVTLTLSLAPHTLSLSHPSVPFRRFFTSSLSVCLLFVGRISIFIPFFLVLFR